MTTYAPAFKATEFDEIAALSDHIVFNSTAQIERFAAAATKADASIGLRVNPEHSEGAVEKYDPCAVGSRLGQPLSQLTDLPDNVRGVHMHTLCEQGFAPLARTVDTVRGFLQTHREQVQWLNWREGIC